jgi:hypothetical protein
MVALFILGIGVVFCATCFIKGFFLDTCFSCPVLDLLKRGKTALIERLQHRSLGAPRFH